MNGFAASIASAPTDVLVRRGVPVPMRDGTILRADVYLPAAADGPRPVLLQRTPYDRTSSASVITSLGLEPHAAIDRGFALVVQDVRGRWASDGEFDPFGQEGDDGEDTIAWIAAQPWCDGDVAMWGASYVGATQMLAAVRAPVALRAISPQMTSDDYFDGWTYRGGAEQLGFVVSWLLRGLGGGALERLRRRDPAAAARLASRFDALADDPQAAMRADQSDFAADLRELAPYLDHWRAHHTRDAWWRATSTRDGVERVAVPALHLAGWHDIFLTGTLANYTALCDRAATAEARAGQRLVVGPWTHAARGEAVGELLLGRRAARAWLDPTTLQLDFFAAVLRGEQPPGPPVRLWTLGANRWRDEDAWPPARTREQPWLLGAPHDRDRTLGPQQPPAGARSSTFAHDPADPVPTVAGATMLPGDELCLTSGPRDRCAVQRRADVLSFTSEPLERDTELTGLLRAALWLTADAPDFDIVATLSWVEPGGRALHLSDGILRLSFRDGLDGAAAPLQPGEPVHVEVALDPVSITLPAGTRLRFEVAGSCFPRFALHPDVRAPLWIDVLHDATHPSHVALPFA